MRFGLGLALAAAIAVCGPAQAQQTTRTPIRLALSYDGRLIVKVLDIHFDEQVSPTQFNAAASLRSYGLLAAIKTFNVQANASGRVEGGALRPGVFRYDNRDGKRERRVLVTWRGGDVDSTSSPSFGNMGQPPASPAQKLAAADPLTQLMRITIAAGPGGVCSGAPRFFDGKQLYALAFEPGQPVAVTAEQRAIGLTSAVHCNVRYYEVAGFKHKKNDKGFNSVIGVTFGQLGAGGPWVIGKMSSDTPLGPAIIELKQAQVSRDLHLAWE